MTCHPKSTHCILNVVLKKSQSHKNKKNNNNKKRNHWESNYGVPERQGSHGEQALSRRSLTPTAGDKGCTASSGYLLPCPTGCSLGWSVSPWGQERFLKEPLHGPGGWVLLLLTRNDRGMAERWLREPTGDEVKIQPYEPAGVWKVNSFMSLTPQMSHTCWCMFSYSAKAWGFLNK